MTDRSKRHLLAPIAMSIVLLVSACTADDPVDGVALLLDAETAVVVANSPGTLTTTGTQRVMVALVGSGPNAFIGGPDEGATFEFTPAASDSDEPATEVTGQWVSPPGVPLGLYVAPFEFPQAGSWTVSVKGSDESVPAAIFEVATESAVPQIGDPPPASQTLTGSTAEELEAISTDLNPDPSFYDLSIHEAIANGRPTVIVFATPAFCQTAVCGPTVEIAKSVADGRDDVDFVHVEPWDVAAARAGTLNPIEPLFEWGLVTEPWVFVIDGDGLVAASFEGVIGERELAAAIDGL